MVVSETGRVVVNSEVEFNNSATVCRLEGVVLDTGCSEETGNVVVCSCVGSGRSVEAAKVEGSVVDSGKKVGDALTMFVDVDMIWLTVVNSWFLGWKVACSVGTVDKASGTDNADTVSVGKGASVLTSSVVIVF